MQELRAPQQEIGPSEIKLRLSSEKPSADREEAKGPAPVQSELATALKDLKDSNKLFERQLERLTGFYTEIHQRMLDFDTVIEAKVRNSQQLTATAQGYAKQVEDLEKLIRWKPYPLIYSIDQYLKQEPTNTDEKRLENWRKLKPINCDVIEKYWLRVDSEKIDYSDCFFQDDEYFGKETVRWGLTNGPTRYINSISSGIVIGTLKDDETHGLYIEVSDKEIFMSLEKNGD